MKRFATLAAALALATPALAQFNLSYVATETEILPVTGKADYDSSATAVDSAGVIYTVDSDGSDTILKITPGSPATVEILIESADILTELTSAGLSGATSFNPRGLAVAADGDLVVSGFTGGTTGDSVVTLSTSIPSTVTVVYTPTGGATSLLDGSGALTAVGNTAYVATDTNNGTTNSIWELDTNAGSVVTPTELVTEATLVAAAPGGTANTDVGLNDLATDGTDILAIMSATAAAPDNIYRITTGGTVTLEVDSADIIADLQGIDGSVTDVGFGSVGIDASNRIWVTNPFGDGSFDNGLLVMENISGGAADTSGLTGADIEAALGLAAAPFLANDSLGYDATNGRMILAEGEGEGIVAVEDAPANVGDWLIYD